ncbi:ENTH/VHS family protein [Abeliophyllum distichum]|uniref:ENTH/VHS family protein n=1 Tax=Abeliophyllum distichum TaxID=126358 RepID=A0ABD1SDL6_9LAMI
MAKKVPLLYLANDILQNSKRNGNEFVIEFWKVLPAALKEVKKGNDHEKNVVSRLVKIWEERRVFGSRNQSLGSVMLGEELPPPLEIGKKRSRSVRIVKRDSRSIKTKLTIGGTAEKIVSAFHLVLSEHTSEDEEMNKCKSTVNRVKKMEKDVSVVLTKAKDSSWNTLAKEIEEEENLLKQSIEKLKVVEANRLALVSQLRDALREQESELENVRMQMQVAQAQAEEAAKMRKRLHGDHVEDAKPSTVSSDANTKPAAQTTRKSAAAIAAEVADKLAASSSSQYIMTSVFSTLAAEEAKNAGLMKPSTSSAPFSSGFNTLILKPENHLPVSDPIVFISAPQLNPPQNNAYQSLVATQPTIQGQIDSQAQYHSIPNPPRQYLQPSGGIVGLYDYGSLPPLPPGPPPPAPPPYMVSPMVPLVQQPLQISQQQPLAMGQQPHTFSQQQPGPLPQQPPPDPNFRLLPPMQAPGMVYYGLPYQSQ